MDSSRAAPAQRFPENSGKPKKPAVPIYGGWFRVLSGGFFYFDVKGDRDAV